MHSVPDTFSWLFSIQRRLCEPRRYKSCQTGCKSVPSWKNSTWENTASDNLRYFCLMACCLSVFACGKASSYENPYYDRMKKLTDQVEADPKDKTALHKLESYTKGSDEWDRFYAYVSIYILAGKNVGGAYLIWRGYFPPTQPRQR